MIYLAIIEAYNLTISAVETLRFCTGPGYIDEVAGDYYEPRIEQPASMRRDIFQDGQIGGAASASYGELTLINADGELDYLTGYAFDGRSLNLKVGEQGAAFSSFTTIIYATIQQAAFEELRISIRLRDRIAELDKPVQPNRYGGSNSLPAGVDGTSELKDAPKPKLFGRVANVTPLLVNSARLIYQVNDGPIENVVNVFDKGTYLARGNSYADQADMEANPPAAGYYRVWQAGGMFRLGGSPAGLITCTAWASWDIADCTAAQIAYDLVIGAGILSGDTYSADRTALDGQNAGSIGLWVTDGLTVAEALDRVSASVGAWWGFDRLNRFRMARLDAPGGTSVATLTELEIVSLERQAATVNGTATPVWQVTLGHDVNWTVQTSDNLAGIVPDDRRAWLAAGSRQVKASDTAVKTKHPLAQEVTYETLLAGDNYGDPEAARRLSLLKAERVILTAKVQVDADLLYVLDLGVVVTVQYPRYGLAAGQQFRIIGIETDFAHDQVILSLWG
ncbi:hypothetical protein ACQE3D_12585 [Methylomonas sp. MS20]|uniref:hypothetical protein n=1 Tax=Methylomonas sp. MS20 TaxID=3418769 RepID=UPI003D065B76